MLSQVLQRTFIGLDFFDASINRVAAWVIRIRNMIKALLYGLLTLNENYCNCRMQRLHGSTGIVEDIKTLPFGDVWDEYCRREGVPVCGEWFNEVKKYEQDVLSKRG